jgi:hypothetical protein
MWILTTIGFFSVVQKRGDSFLTVRARIASDLEDLRKKYMPELSDTVTGQGTDYPYRATISHDNFTRGMVKLMRDIRHSSFKNELSNKMGSKREKVCAKTRHDLQDLGGLTNET